MVDWINHVCAIFFLTSLYQYNQTSNAINFFTLIYMYKVILYKTVHSLSNRAILSMLQLVVLNAIFNTISFIYSGCQFYQWKKPKYSGVKGECQNTTSFSHKKLLQVVSFLQEECHSIRASCAFDQSDTTSGRNLCTSQSRRRV